MARLHGVEWETSRSLSLGSGKRLKRLITAVYGKEENVLKISVYLQDSLYAAKRRKLHSGADSWIAVKTPVMMPFSMEILPAFAVTECPDLLNTLSAK